MRPKRRWKILRGDFTFQAQQCQNCSPGPDRSAACPVEVAKVLLRCVEHVGRCKVGSVALEHRVEGNQGWFQEPGATKKLLRPCVSG